jgi:hypothetical protein
MNTKDYLDGEIKRLYDRMTKLDPESKEYATLEENWTKLVNQKLEIEKHEASTTQTEKQMKADRNDRVARYFIETGKVILPLGTAVVMTLLAYTFEAKGVIPVGIGKKWADKITKY